MARPAVFFDRDDTLIRDPGYLADPDQVDLFDDAAPAIRQLRDAGYQVVIITNQSGIARGLLTEAALAQIHRRLTDELASRGAEINGIYYCPYLDGPDAQIARYRRASDWRKPQPGMLLAAADDLGLDLPRSWMIGDKAADIEAGQRAGCRTILIERQQAQPNARAAGPTAVVSTLLEAARMVQANGQTTTTDPNVDQPPADEATGSGPNSGAPADGPTKADPGRPQSGGGLRQLLTEIRDSLDRRQRRGRQDDFSLWRLAGTLLQMLTIVAGVWGLAALVDDSYSAAIARLILAVLLQLAVLTIILHERRD